MQITHKFRLYPNKEQQDKLDLSLEVCRQTYNHLLAELNEGYTKNEIQNYLLDLKVVYSEMDNVHSKVLQMENQRLFGNLSSLAKLKDNGKKVGRLRFKGKGWFKTFTYNQSGFKLIQTGKRHQILWLSKIGDILIRVHKNVESKIKQITIKKMASGRWFASMIGERKEEMIQQPINKVIGIDLGLIDVVYDSDGNKIANPRHLKKKEKKLKYLQRRMSLKKKGSNNRDNWRTKLARQYERLTDSRNDFLHKLSRYYVDSYDAIGMENMPIINMVHNNLSKSILDSSWGRLRQFISYKAENAGKLYIPVDYKGTTQKCSKCGAKVPKELKNREHKCSCGFVVPRDYNSALEIKRLCLQKIPQELWESTHMEMRPLLNKQVSSMKYEAPCESWE